MLMETCNRCHKPTPYNCFKFKIEEDTIFKSKWEELCTPETKLDDFHLCPTCMLMFIDFVKRGKK